MGVFVMVITRGYRRYIVQGAHGPGGVGAQDVTGCLAEKEDQRHEAPHAPHAAGAFGGACDCIAV